MPRRAKRGCAHRGCPNLVEAGAGGYCPTHAAQHQVERNKRIDAQRGTAAQRGYDARWRRIRAMYLRNNPLCVHCLANGHTTPATDVDHITPLAVGGTHAPDNLQSLCHSCHSRKTVQQSLGWSPSPPKGDQIPTGWPEKTGAGSLPRATAKLDRGGMEDWEG